MRYLKLKEKIIQNKTQLIFSLFVSFFLIIAGYFANNWPLFTGEDLKLYTQIECIKRLLTQKEEELDGVLFINTSFDKKLIKVYDDGDKNYPLGVTEITNRKKLFQFLKLLSKIEYAYGYVIIDIRFPEGLEDVENPEIDNELFSFIKSMPRCVVATHKGMKLMGNLVSKAALADYKSTVTSTNFVRYQYFDSIPSIPLFVYNEMRKKERMDTIKYDDTHWGAIYKEEDKLCQNCLFLEFSSYDFNRLKRAPTEFGDSIYVYDYNYRNLGSDYIDYIKNDETEQMVLDMLRAQLKESGDKPIVIIGNITEDLHDTYAGLQPGMIILYKAIDALNKGRHYVSMLHYFLLFLAYYFITLFTIRKKSIVSFIPMSCKKKHIFLFFILEMTSLTFVLYLINFIDIKFYHTTTNFFFVTLFFSLVNLYSKFKTVLQTYETL